MDACEPRVRRRGFFLHSDAIGEPETGEHENPEGVSGSRDSSRHALPRTRDSSRSTRTVQRSHEPRAPMTARNQIWERDWQPSTGTLAPLIQLARGDARNATTAPTSSGRPKRPNGSSRLTKSAMPAGSSC